MTNLFRPQGAFDWFSYTTSWDTIFKAAIADPEHRFDGIMTQVLAGGSIPALDALLVAVELVIEQGSLSADHSLHVLA